MFCWLILVLFNSHSIDKTTNGATIYNVTGKELILLAPIAAAVNERFSNILFSFYHMTSHLGVI